MAATYVPTTGPQRLHGRIEEHKPTYDDSLNTFWEENCDSLLSLDSDLGSDRSTTNSGFANRYYRYPTTNDPQRMIDEQRLHILSSTTPSGERWSMEEMLSTFRPPPEPPPPPWPPPPTPRPPRWISMQSHTSLVTPLTPSTYCFGCPMSGSSIPLLLWVSPTDTEDSPFLVRPYALLRQAFCTWCPVTSSIPPLPSITTPVSHPWRDEVEEYSSDEYSFGGHLDEEWPFEKTTRSSLII